MPEVAQRRGDVAVDARGRVRLAPRLVRLGALPLRPRLAAPGRAAEEVGHADDEPGLHSTAQQSSERTAECGWVCVGVPDGWLGVPSFPTRATRDDA